MIVRIFRCERIQNEKKNTQNHSWKEPNDIENFVFSLRVQTLE